jgi:hypothetical protein
MRVIASRNIRIADLFKCFLKNVPKSTETIEVSHLFILAKNGTRWVFKFKTICFVYNLVLVQ